MPKAGTSALSRHSTRPTFSPTIVSHVAHDSLRHQIAVEERLRNPRGRIVGLIDEVEEGLSAFRLRPRVGRVPVDHDIADAHIEPG